MAGVIPGTVAPLNRAWMAAGVSKQDLLYVSDGNGEVTVYRYWQHTLVGALTSMAQPMGSCVDAVSDVYVTDYAGKKIFEFVHGGTKPIKKLDDSPDSPYACSVDPTTGNLAVANDNNGTSQPGNIAIWTKGSGTPQTYTTPEAQNFNGCAYDNDGSLLVTGFAYSGPADFAWLPKGGTKLVPIKVPGPNPSREWYYVNGLEWDGKYFGIGAGYLYRVSVTHGQAYYVGMTTFSSSGIGGPFWFYNNKPGSQATELVGGVNTDEGSVVYYWNYPYGGSPLYQLTHGVDKPAGITISLRTN